MKIDKVLTRKNFGTKLTWFGETLKFKSEWPKMKTTSKWVKNETCRIESKYEGNHGACAYSTAAKLTVGGGTIGRIFENSVKKGIFSLVKWCYFV